MGSYIRGGNQTEAFRENGAEEKREVQKSAEKFWPIMNSITICTHRHILL
jgi:hypothetical protein